MMPLNLASLTSSEKRELICLLEERERRACRKSLLAWAKRALEPLGQSPAAHHRLLIRELEAAIQGRTPRLMINLPPGSAKTTYSTIISPAWALAQRPTLDVICASNTGLMAEAFSRRTQALIRDHGETLGYGLTRETAEEWTTSNGGHYRAAGIGGAVAGTRADLVLIDDPTRSRADADSETVRESQWNWFTGDLRTRLKPEATIIVVMTRWHPDDLGGRLIDRQPGLWRVVSIPAIAEDDDALGRAPGQYLWEDSPDYAYGAELRKVYAEYQTAGAMRDWQALYQQHPRPAEGSLFKIGKIDVLEVPPPLRGATIARGWDLAATKQIGTRDPDWTVGVKLARELSGRYVVLDVTRFRGGPDEVDNIIHNTTHQDGAGCKVSLPQDPGQAGKAQALAFTRLLTGYQVETSPETGAKETRAAPIASQVNGGNLAIVRAPWNATFLDELAAFPSGVKDDQVDALSRAFGVVGLGVRKMVVSPDVMRMLGQR